MSSPSDFLHEKASANRDIKYACTKCGDEVGRANLKVKRVQYREMGEGGLVIRTRVTDWLCLKCLEADPDYNRPSRSTSPGMKDTKLAHTDA